MSISLSSVTSSSATLTIVEPSTHNNTRYWKFVTTNKSSVDSYTCSATGTSSTFTKTISGLSADTTYTTTATYGPSTGYEYSGGSVTYTTAASYTLTASSTATATTLSITATISTALSSDRTVTFYITSPSTRSFSKTLSAGETSVTGTFTTNIEPATVYTWYVAITADSKTTSSYNRRTLNNFSWTNTKTSGGEFNLTASEWNSFTSQLKSKESYYTSTSRTFTTATSGGNFTATMMNQAINATNNIAGSTVISTVSTGDTVYAATLNKLVSYLNS